MPFILPANTLSAGGYNVANSLRFNSGSSDYLNRSASGSASVTEATISVWIKRASTGGNHNLYNGAYQNNNTYYFRAYINSDDQLEIENKDGSTNLLYKTNRKFRDLSAWYNIVIKLSLTASGNDRCKVFINGVQETSFATQTAMSGDQFFTGKNNYTVQIGETHSGENDYFNGYMSEFVYVQGTALDPTSFGEFDEDSGIWKPIDVSGLTFGNNGFYLPFTNKGKIHTVTAHGGVHHDTAQKKLGSSSIEFDGNGDYLSVNDIGQFVFEQDFTVEFFARLGDQADNYTTIMDDPANNRFRVNLGSAATSAPKLTFYSTVWDAHTSGTSDIGDGAWHHCAIVRDNGTLRIFVDGSQENTRASSGGLVDLTGVLEIGRYNGGASLQYEGYLDEIRISNIARYTSGFTPTTSAFADDEFTRLLIHSNTTDGSTTFTDSSGVAGGMGNDESGNNNDFISNNINSSVDQSTDTCTNNAATMSPLDSVNVTLSEGNLSASCASSSGVRSTIAVADGKFYAEVKFQNTTSVCGVAAMEQPVSTFNGIGAVLFGQSGAAPELFLNGGTPSTYANAGNFAANDIMQIALDMDNSRVYFGKNGSWFGGTSWTESTPTTAHTLTSGYTYGFVARTGSGTSVNIWNFGSPSFAISSGNTDANDYGNFEYAVPSGYYALNTKNLAEFG